MKYFCYIFIYLNILISFSEVATAQKIQLKLVAEDSIPQGLLDTLAPKYTFKNYLELKRQVDTLLPQLQRLGFLESRLEGLTQYNDSIYLANYYLGNRWKEITIYFLEEDINPQVIRRLTNKYSDSSFTLPIHLVERTLQFLNENSTQKGNAFGRLKLKNIKSNNKEALSAQLQVENGALRRLDQIVIKGYEKFPRSYLTYYAGIKTDKPFSQKKILEQNELLNNLGFVNSIKPPEALFRKDSTSIYLYLERKNNNLFDGILGFATNEETQKLEFNGYLNLELNNNLNFGEQLLINFKADGREQQNFGVKTTLPYLFKSPLGLSLELKIFKRDSTFATTDQQARLSYQANPNTSLYLGYKGYESSNLLDEIIAGSTVEDYTSKFALIGASYSRPQIMNFFPVKTFIGVDAEIGTRETSNAEENQFKISTRLSYIFNLNETNSIYVNNNSSLLSSENYLTNELFRFGGINSIRGFSENSIDASLFSVLNTEYRYIFSRSTYLHSIIDLAYFENQTLDLKEELYSFGLGLGLQTEAGIFRFNIANGVSQEQNFKFSNTKIHISLSSRF